MPLTIVGNGGQNAEVSGDRFRGLHVVPRPLEYTTHGAYQISQITGTIGAGLAAASEIFQFRWVDATDLAVIQRVRLTGMYQLTAFTAGAGLFQLTPSRSWSADGSGGTTLTPTGNTGKLRTSMNASGGAGATCRIASTAALGAGTKTLDSLPIATFTKFIPALINSQVFDVIDLYRPDIAGGEHPLVLATSEGFSIRATVPATGTWVIGVEVQWTEVLAF